jgi:schlafen family protein
MDIDDNILTSLLFEEENNCLDFKRDQYRFTNCNDIQKSELLKDILSFANGWRRADAYILIGVKEIKAEKHEVVGVEELLDDSTLQQFVNSKVQKPIDFIYKNIKLDERFIGVIKIPIQDRPFYLTKDFGKLKKNVVYIRRGTSTDEATPDEILTMKDGIKNVVSVSPKLDLSLTNDHKERVTQLEVEPYKKLKQTEVIENLSKLIIKPEILNLVDRFSKILDSIEDRYPDGNKFYPYRAEYIYEFNREVNESISLAKDDFQAFCKHANLILRSFELKDSSKANFRKNRNARPFFSLLNIENKGTSPAEGVVIYLEDSESVKFCDWEELKRVSLKPYSELPESISNIVKKVLEYKNGIDSPIVTMYERVTGRKWDSFQSPLSDLSHLVGHVEKPYSSQRDKDKAKIIIKKELLHNHNFVFYAENIFLCPMVTENEIGEFNYEIHAKNLPQPVRGTCEIIGKTIT